MQNEKTRKSITGRDLLLMIEKQKCIPDNILIRSGDKNKSIPRGLYKQFTALELIVGHTKEYGRLEFYELIDSDVLHNDVSRIPNELIAKIGAVCLVGGSDDTEIVVDYTSSRNNNTRVFQCHLDAQGIKRHFEIIVNVGDLHK